MKGPFVCRHVACIAPFVAMMLAGCTTTEVVPPGSRFVISVPRASFYKYGPAQSFGPDLQLAQGQRVTMLERAFGYSKVRTDDGLAGYVASDDLTAAPPEPKATPPPKEQTFSSSSSGSRKGSNVRPTPGSPLFDVNDVPAPLPGDPEPKPAPPFRF